MNNDVFPLYYPPIPKGDQENPMAEDQEKPFYALGETQVKWLMIL